MEVELYYERCRALLRAIWYAEDEDRDALVCLLEEQFKVLGEAIENIPR